MLCNACIIHAVSVDHTWSCPHTKYSVGCFDYICVLPELCNYNILLTTNDYECKTTTKESNYNIILAGYIYLEKENLIWYVYCCCCILYCQEILHIMASCCVVLEHAAGVRLKISLLSSSPHGHVQTALKKTKQP